MVGQNIWSELVEAASRKFDFWMQVIATDFPEMQNLEILSFILMTIALILFLILMIIIYIRGIIYFIKNNNPKKNLAEQEMAAKEKKQAMTAEQEELEKELQKELDLALAEREQIAKQEEEEDQQEQKENKEKEAEVEAQEIKNKETKAKKENLEKKQKEKVKKAEVDFDWQKGKIPPADVKGFAESELTFSYKQSEKELHQLMGLVIDMLGRGVDDLKIAQTLNFKSSGMSDENEILKAIDAVKKFIELSISGKFAKLKMYDSLPKEDQALYHLSQGDPSLALALMENLMDNNIDKAIAGNSEEKKQRLYGDVSNWACCFGALAEINDIMLATSAYELAIELQSSNVTAWSRLGDVYKEANAASKAMWAYQNVLNFADEEIDAEQVANARKNLSEHLYAEGNSLQAAKLYNGAKQYYDSLGINRRLDKQEIEIVDVIENNYQQSLPETIKKLLSGENQRN